MEGSNMRRLKPSEIKEYREERLASVGGVCELCGLPLTADNAVLDHSHKHGWIRGVLHRGCNALLGKIENNYKRVGVPDLEKFLACAWFYIAEGNGGPFPDDVYHPSYRTPEEKRLLRNKRARRKRKAKKAE